MEKGINFRTIESQNKYFDTYDRSLKLISVPIIEKYVSTSFGESHIIFSGDEKKMPLILLHAASCGSPIWYQNIPCWSKQYCIYAIDLIGESSKSILKKKVKTPIDNARWLHETICGLNLDKFYLCGLSIGGWTAVNYAGFYPEMISKLILLSPVQTFSRMYNLYFVKIMKMGFNPTRENIENYIGWGSAKEAPLPNSIIEQFTLSVMNMNPNISFPKWIKKKHLLKLSMPVLILFGEDEFAFSVTKAIKRAKILINNLEIEIVHGASHLLPVSKPEYVNQRVSDFIMK